MSKGMTILSEIVMGIGMITLGVIFSLISSQIIAGQQSNILGGAQNEMAAELQQNIELVQGFEDTTKISYTPPVDLYTIEVREGDIVLDIEGEETANFGTQSVKIQDTNIEDSDELCIIKNSTQVKISQKSCKSIDKSELCRDGCDPNSCQPQYGDTCSTPACEYPEHAESDEATKHCEPAYNPDYIDEGESTTDMGFVDQDYTQVQRKGDQCTKNFECGEASGENLECNAAIASGPSGSYCCNEGQKWNGTRCVTSKTYDVYFVASSSSYATSSDYRERAEKFADSITEHTPFKECSPLVNKEIFESTSVPNSNYDLRVEVTDQLYRGGCNAYSEGYGSGKVKIFKIGGEAEEVVLPHEMGHEFGLCDEYSRSTYTSQANYMPENCYNPWPSDKGWYPAKSCSNLNDGESPAGTCGRDLDNEQSTKAASIMGGGGAWEDSCGNTLIVPQPGLEPEANGIKTGYDNWMEEINSRGYQCG